jgi:uncharacterized protein (TIGR02147 family)
MSDLDLFDYRRELRNLLNERRSRNSSYSLRALARDLSVSPTALHGVLSGSRHFSKKNLESLAIKLGWSQIKLEAALNNTIILEDTTEIILEDDRFRMIADWIHLAILNLVNIPSTRRESIPERLGLSRDICERAIDRLLRLEYLEVKDGQLVRRVPAFGTKQDTPSLAIRAFHYKNLKKAQEVLETVPVENRDFLTAAVPTNLKQVQKLKKMIQEFRKEAMQTLETANPTEVYFLNVQLYPVSHSGQEKKI